MGVSENGLYPAIWPFERKLIMILWYTIGFLGTLGKGIYFGIRILVARIA
jgi:hypothetical protein